MDSGFGWVIIVYLAVFVALAVLTVALIVLVFAAIRVLRLSAKERELRIEQMRHPAPFDGPVDRPGDSPTA